MTFQFGHIGPHDMLGPFNPFQTHAMPSEQGCIFGTMDNGRPFYFDPYGWMKEGLTGGTSIQFIGFRNSGKTTAAQVAAARSSIFKAAPGIPRRVAVDDTRNNAGVPEYYAFANALGGQHTNLAEFRINILDPKMRMQAHEQRLVVSNTLASVGRNDLTVPERAALLTGIHVLNMEAGDEASTEVLEIIQATLDLSDYDRFLKTKAEKTLDDLENPVLESRLRQRLDRGLNITAEEFRQGARSVAESLNLLHDEYGDVFGGTHSMYDILNDPVVALNMTTMDEDVIPIVEMLLWMWRNAAARRNDHNLMAHIEIHDENWQRWESELYGRNMINHLKKIRANGTVIIKIMHRPSDVLQVGHAGQRQQSLAISGIRETDVWFIGQTQSSDFDDLQKYVRLPKKYLSMLPTFGQGDFIVVIGEKIPPFPIHLDITDAEKLMTATNKALYDIAGDKETTHHALTGS